MASNTEELTKDLEELRRLLSEATLTRSKKILTNEIQVVEREIEKKTKSAANSNSTISSKSNLPTTKLTNYAWDQSEKFLKLYVTVPGAAPGQENRVKLDVKPKSVDFNAEDIDGKNFLFTVKGLLFTLDVEESSFKVKKGEVLLMLKKKDVGKEWPCVTEMEMQAKEKSKPKLDADPQANMMSMMKQMYDEGDDETKRSIKKAWMEAEDKKRSGGGAGGAGDAMGFGDFM